MKHKNTTSPHIIVRTSQIHGRGVFARKDIAKGTRIIEYVGERITKAEAERRAEDPLSRHKKDQNYGAVYLFVLNKRYDIDGNVSYNTARHINHSCEPNAETDVLRGKIWIIALQNIKKGEEITYNYGYDYDGYDEHRCYCRTNRCVGYILAEEHWPQLKKDLIKKIDQKLVQIIRRPMKKLILIFAFLLALAGSGQAKESLIDKQIAGCDRVGYPEWRDDCYESLGPSILDYSICVKLTLKSRRDACIAKYPPQSAADCQLNKANKKEQTACLASFGQASAPVAKKAKPVAAVSLSSEQIDQANKKEQAKAEKLQQEKEERQTKALEKAVKSEAAKEAHITKTQTKKTQTKTVKTTKKSTAASDAKAEKMKKDAEAKQAKEQEKADKIQAAQDARNAKEQEKAAKLQQEQDARAAKEQEKIAKLQQAQDSKSQMKAAKLQAAQDAKQAQADEKAAKLQAAQDARDAKEQEKAAKLEQAKAEKEAKAQEKAAKLQQENEAKQMAKMKHAEPEPDPVMAEPIVEETMVEEIVEPAIEYAPEPVAEELPKKTKAQEKAEKAQKEKEERDAKAQEKAAKLKAEKEAAAQAKAEKAQKAKEAEEALAREKAAKIQKAKVEEQAKAQQKAEKSQKAPKAKEKPPAKNISGEPVAAAKAQKPGCTKGFGSWTEPPQKKNLETACDKENVEQFALLLNRCIASDHDINILSYDMNKDLCVTCDDLKQWQKQVNRLFDAKKRSTDGRNLKLKECAERKF